jgi:uncharacterized protein with von Willebrand factor type A (vWA) domain
VLVATRRRSRAFDACSSRCSATATGGLRPRRGAHRVAAPPTSRRSEHGAASRERARSPRRAPAGEAEDDDAEVEVPLALASDEERLADKRFDALEPHELAQLYRLMTRLRSRPRAAHAPLREGPPRPAHRPAPHAARQPAHGGDPIRLARRRRRVVRRRLVMLCDISGSMEPYARAYLQFLTCAAGSGPNAEAFVFATRLTR